MAEVLALPPLASPLSVQTFGRIAGLGEFHGTTHEGPIRKGCYRWIQLNYLVDDGVLGFEVVTSHVGGAGRKEAIDLGGNGYNY